MRHIDRTLKAIALASASASCLIWQPAVAQTTGQQTAQAGGGGQIEEVIVTARKREENLQKVPLAVSVSSGLDLQQHHITDVYGLQTLTPSLQVENEGGLTPGVASFAIRGIGTAIYGPQVESSVGVVVDDVPLSRVALGTLELFDINNVQVLRGPQGMLFGKNAAAGLINIVTNNPELNTTDVIAHAEYGSMDTPNAGNSARVDLGVNVAVTDDSALRVDGFFTHYDGFIKNVFIPQFFGENIGGLRAKYLWEPISTLKVLFAADYTLENGPGEAAGSNRSDTPFGGPGLVRAIDQSLGITASPRNDLQASGDPNNSHFQVFGASMKVEYDLGDDYTLTNVAAYRARQSVQDVDVDVVPLNGYTNDNNATQNQVTEELRLTSPADQRFTYQAGFFYLRHTANFGLRSTTDVFDALGAPPPGYAFIGDWAQISSLHEESEAGYFEGQFKLLDSLRLTAGARYTHDTQDYGVSVINYPDGFLTQPPAGASAPIGIGPNATAANTNEKDNISYRAILDYDIAQDVMAYVSYAKGYKGPTFNGSIIFNPNPTVSKVNDEIPTDWEVGLKSTLLDDRLRLNLALFDEIFRGFQTQTIPPGGIFVTVNAGKLRSRGAELEATAIPLDGLTINGGLTYNHTEYVDLFVPCYVGQPGGPTSPPGPNGITAQGLCNYTPPGTNQQAFYTGNASGNQLADAPQWTETVTVRYEHPVWEGWNGFLQGNGYFRSPYNFTQFENPNTEVGASAIFGLSAGVQSDDGRYGASVFVRNLTDKRVPIFISAGIGTLLREQDYFQQFGPDSFRTVGVTLDYHM